MWDRGVRSWVGESVCSLGLAVVGLWFAVVSRRLPMLEDGVPGPGLAPALLGLALIGLGLGIALAAVVRRSSEPILVLDRDTLLAIGAMLAAVIAFERVGYMASAFLFLLSSFVLIGREPWQRAGIVAAVATIVTWSLFAGALGVALPSGLLGRP